MIPLELLWEGSRMFVIGFGVIVSVCFGLRVVVVMTRIGARFFTNVLTDSSLRKIVDS